MTNRPACSHEDLSRPARNLTDRAASNDFIAFLDSEADMKAARECVAQGWGTIRECRGLAGSMIYFRHFGA